MAQSINYKFSINNTNNHYAEVTVFIKNIKDNEILLKMPVWTPGSYMVREFERNVIKAEAYANNKALDVSKVDKNTWKIDNKAKNENVEFKYWVYCFELGIRTTYIDNDRAFILPTSSVMFVEKYGNIKGEIEFIYPSNWAQISTTLEKKAANTYTFSNYDDLADSPIEIGNHKVLKFDVMGVPHEVAMVGRNNCDEAVFIKDLKKVCETAYNVFNVHPCKSYLFIVHHVDEGGGGLEHANSNVVQVNRFAYSNLQKYKAFLGLCAHEYFHLWNIKRIRPMALGPFNYSQENYTNLLWVAEGITSYYDELLLLRAGVWTKEEYINAMQTNINNTVNRIGGSFQSMHESSFDAWIKEYRPNENSSNSAISYYLKGGVIAALLDIELIAATDGKKSMDDLLKYLYQDFYITKKRGFTDAEFYQAINIVAGKTIDFQYWTSMPNDVNTIEKMKAIFLKAGIKFENKPIKLINYTGINIENKADKTFVKSVNLDAFAMLNGFNAGDEIIAIDDIRIKNNFDEVIKLLQSEKEYNVIISRAGLIKTLKLKCTNSEKASVYITIPEQNSLANKWLKVD